MTFFVLRQIHPPGMSAVGTPDTIVELVKAAVEGTITARRYLEWYDLEAHGGRGSDRWTNDVRKAIRFDSFDAAISCWRQQSKTVPLRDDGEPNRPLTAYSVTIQEVES